jgi:hypothetical protein
VKGSNSTRSAGWQWYEQARNLRSSFFKRVSLHELQAHVVSARLVNHAYDSQFFMVCFLYDSSLSYTRNRLKCRKVYGVKLEWRCVLRRKLVLIDGGHRITIHRPRKVNFGSVLFGEQIFMCPFRGLDPIQRCWKAAREHGSYDEFIFWAILWPSG